MKEDELERQLREISEKLRQKDEAELKKVEQEWRQAMSRDTAGHVFQMFQYLEARLADLQAQIDLLHPEFAMARSLGARLSAIEAALSRGGGGK